MWGNVKAANPMNVKRNKDSENELCWFKRSNIIRPIIQLITVKKMKILNIDLLVWDNFNVGIILFTWLKLCIKQKYNANETKGGRKKIINERIIKLKKNLLFKFFLFM